MGQDEKGAHIKEASGKSPEGTDQTARTVGSEGTHKARGRSQVAGRRKRERGKQAAEGRREASKHLRTENLSFDLRCLGEERLGSAGRRSTDDAMLDGTQRDTREKRGAQESKGGEKSGQKAVKRIRGGRRTQTCKKEQAITTCFAGMSRVVLCCSDESINSSICDALGHMPTGSLVPLGAS
jgi:hypothetical protein